MPVPVPPRRSRLLARAVALLGALLVPLLLSGTAHAAAPASVRVAHLSPDTDGVDVYLRGFDGTDQLVVPKAEYGSVSGYMQLPEGTYTVLMRPAGSPTTAPAMISWSVQAKAGSAYTAAAVGTGAQRRGTVFDDDLTPPAAGSSRVRLIQAASTTPQVDLQAVNGPLVANDAAFATATGYAEVPGGRWKLQAEALGAPVANATITLTPGNVASVLLLDKPGGGVMLTSTVDAAGLSSTVPRAGGAVPAPAVQVPAGGIQTGGGYLATHSATHSASHSGSPGPSVGLLLGVAVLALLGVGAVRARA